jgi:thiosulfate/3-mercaptopyruvate sulfurtransferase
MAYTTLISAADLALHIADNNWIILDCRHDLANADAGRNAFAAGHIPGAQFVQLDDDLSGSKINASGVFCGRHPLPDRATFINVLRSWGIGDNSQVIAYDAHGGMFAARLWWMLRWVGHSQVAVLDGGLPAWTGALSTEIVVQPLGSISDKESLVRSVNVAEVLANIQSQQMTIVDARSPDRFRGENETLDKVGGHIPGAKNHFFKDNLQADGRFKSAEKLREDFSAIINNSDKAIMQCGSGVTACHNLLALEVAGMTGAALYAGSWSEWCADSARPVA